jgi:phosphoglycolate phosphatase-like HAD superfamily hydrolase
MIKAIFFDFDGTISDAKGIAFDSAVRVLNEFGYKFSEAKLRKLMGTKMHIILKKLGVPVKDVQKIRKRFYKYFTEAAVAGGIKPCVSLKPLWEMKDDIPLIVISNSKTSFLRASIKKLKLKGLFKKVYGADKFPLTPKGVPPAQKASAAADKGGKDDMLEKLFRKIGIRASEAMYVGDRFSDVEFARDAGCVAVAIHNKCAWSSLAVIKKEKPDYIIRDFRELKKIVDSLK